MLASFDCLLATRPSLVVLREESTEPNGVEIVRPFVE